MSEPKLTNKQDAFVSHYLVDYIGAKAARLAGYKGNDATLRATASRLLTNDNVKAEITKRMESQAMESQEALARLAQQARGIDGASMAEVMDCATVADSLKKADELGVGHLIKKIKRYRTKHGKETTERFEIEWIDHQAALFKVLQYTQEMKPQRLVIEDVRAEAIRLIKANEVDFEAMVQQFGKHDAEYLFELAGVPVQAG